MSETKKTIDETKGSSRLQIVVFKLGNEEYGLHIDQIKEVVITPNPIVAIIQPGGTCQPIPFTLINLSTTASIHWDVKGDAPYDQQHIALKGRPEAEGSLSPSGQEENTAVLKVSCSSVRPDVVYKITVYYNDIQVHVPVIIRQSY